MIMMLLMRLVRPTGGTIDSFEDSREFYRNADDAATACHLFGRQSLPHEVTSKLGFTSVVQGYASSVLCRASTGGTLVKRNKL
jgi:hypothetical protein